MKESKGNKYTKICVWQAPYSQSYVCFIIFFFHLCLKIPKVLPGKHHILLHEPNSPELQQTLSHNII